MRSPDAGLTKEERDRRYNFDCPKCRKRRIKRAARLIEFAAGVKVWYCDACSQEVLALILGLETTPRTIDIDEAEQRWKVDLEVLVKEQAEHPRD